MNIEKRTRKLERLANACDVEVAYRLTSATPEAVWIHAQDGEAAGFDTLRKAEAWLRRVKRFGWTAVFCLILAFGAMAQSAEQIANQRLAKAMDVIETQDKYIAALEGKANALEAANKAKDDLLAIVTKQRDTALAMKCNKTSYFFGIVKKTRCY